jgi:hypothetical protein
MPTNDISFLFATINRPQATRRLIESIRRMYPDMPIHVGDQSAPTPEMQAFYDEQRVHGHFLPFDSGVSYCRAELAKQITTDYVLFGDDDFIFTEKSTFDVPRRILQENRHIGLVAGSIIDVFDSPGGTPFRSFRRFEKKIYLDEESQLFISIPIDYLPPELGRIGNRQFYYCDMTLNWALCRRDLFADRRVLWDPQFRSNGEHENFFLQVKKYSPYRVVYYPAMQCDHHHFGGPDYEQMRERQDGWMRFGRKWNVVAHLEVGAGLRYYSDYDNVKQYKFLQCPGLPPAHAPLQPSAYVRVWPEGYVEPSEPACSVQMRDMQAELKTMEAQLKAMEVCVKQTEGELHEVYGSRAWRTALLLRKMAVQARQNRFARLFGRTALAVLRRMPGSLKSALGTHGLAPR